MNVEARCGIAHRSVPNRAQHLTLLIHFDYLVGLGDEIKPPPPSPIAVVSEAAEMPFSRYKGLTARKCLLDIVKHSNVG